MPIDIILSPDKVNNPFEVARRKLVASIAAAQVPYGYPAYPAPDDHEAVRDHIREIAERCDEWLSAVGLEVKSNVTTKVSMSDFEHVFTDAVDGNTLFELDRAAEQLREDFLEGVL